MIRCAKWFGTFLLADGSLVLGCGPDEPEPMPEEQCTIGGCQQSGVRLSSGPCSACQ